jgi:hypothetical protein
MAWARLDDQFPDHPKVERLSDAAFRLHVAGICYCARALSDGHIPRRNVRRLVPDYRPRTLAELLETVWHAAGHACEACPQPEGDGVFVHDYLAVNPPRSEVEERKAKRRAAGRAGGQASATARATANGQARGSTPSHPVPIGTQVSSQPQVGSAVPDDDDAMLRTEARRRMVGRTFNDPAAYEAEIVRKLRAEGWRPPATAAALPTVDEVRARREADGPPAPPPPGWRDAKAGP